MTSFTIAGLRAAGFLGFEPLRSMPARCPAVPPVGGVFAAVLPSAEGCPPAFLETSVGGHFKQQDPTVTGDELAANWVPNAETLYIGSSNDIRRRIHEFAEYGRGKRIGHRGGRYLWQLVDHDRLVICWRRIDARRRPRDVESDLLSEFYDQYVALPFANLRWPRRSQRTQAAARAALHADVQPRTPEDAHAQ